MPAQRAIKYRSAPWRNDAYAAININWKQISPDGDRDERLAWISEFLGHEVTSLTDLTDDQLGAVAGEMKKRVGGQSTVGRRQSEPGAVATGLPPATDNVVVPFGSANIHRGSIKDRSRSFSSGCLGTETTHEAIHLASPEQIYTLEKLRDYLGWGPSDVFDFVKKRVLKGQARFSNSVPNFHRLTFHQATAATNTLLHVAAHRDLKKRSGGKPVSRAAVNKYIPILKAELKIDQTR